jgi:hypothetical protein
MKVKPRDWHLDLGPVCGALCQGDQDDERGWRLRVGVSIESSGAATEIAVVGSYGERDVDSPRISWAMAAVARWERRFETLKLVA